MDLGMKDKVALVTGGARGLGKAVSQLFAAEGARVAVCYRETVPAYVEDLNRDRPGRALAVRCDIRSESEVAALFDRVEQELGPVDFLVNNAAVAPAGGPITGITDEAWDRIFQTNVTGAFHCSRELVRRLRAAGRPGRIVNISSQAAFRGSESGKLAYDASKGALISFTIALARELAPHGIQVNCVAAGLMHTEMMAAAVAKDPAQFNRRVPLGRLGTTEEIGSVVVFLCSAQAAYMTGATVDVSGGLAMH